ncbi:MAG: toll/interleukin-1 receptor domain-containing protein, partial [Candidatus Eremiobacteraeota bacterium]|nr:toll/interleukin-1 receptor domain-containing protein [Candidatus Eremiobacteraeota bacterium]
YDVFISYAHDEFSWVYENVFVPFKDARRRDGQKLAIFFDTSSIRVGSGWQDKISLAIDGSRFVVPVYSDAYFRRPYCRYEIKRAHRKWIVAGEGSRCVLPIMRGKPVILATVDDIQAASIDERPNLVADIIAEIVGAT